MHGESDPSTMRKTTVTTDDTERAVTEWFEAFGSHVAAVEYEPAKGLVADDVVSFGTKAELVRGLDYLVEQQWRDIWPYIEEFQFVSVDAKPTGEGAWAAATWKSTGFDADGEPYHRPGRATVAFAQRDGRWLAVHTHFSLAPGIPRETFGPGGADGN